MEKREQTERPDTVLASTLSKEWSKGIVKGEIITTDKIAVGDRPKPRER